MHTFVALILRRRGVGAGTLALAVLAVLPLLLGAGAQPALLHAQASEPQVTITEFALPAGSKPFAVAPGPDDAIWFTMGGGRCDQGTGNRIGRVGSDGQITDLLVPTENSYPGAIVTGPDGALWFGERRANNIGRLTVDGGFTEYPVPTTTAAQTLPDANVPGLSCTWDSSSPAEGGIVVGPDSALWFTEGFGNKIGRLTTDGLLTEYPIPTAESNPIGITVGPDGALWFVERAGNKIGRITTTSTIVEYPIPTSDSFPNGITVGPDGALWFTELRGDKLGRITASGAVTEYAVPSGTGPLGPTIGPDGALWITGFTSQEIMRLTTSGVITGRYPIPWGDSTPGGIRTGPDGSLWFADAQGSRIGRVTIAGVTEGDQGEEPEGDASRESGDAAPQPAWLESG